MRLARVACAAVVVAGCGGGGDSGGGPGPTPQVASVVITSPTGPQTIGACGTVNFAAQARDAQGNALGNASISWSANPAPTVSFPTATGNSAAGIGTAIGSATVTAASGNTTSSGITVTVQGGTAGASSDVSATASNTFSPVCVTIASGGTVNWSFTSAVAHNVMFGTVKPAGGDIQTTQGTSVSRTFPAAGTYAYTCNLHAGMNGWVVVQ